MPVSAELITSMVNDELRHVSDERVVGHVRALLVPPVVIMRPWDYGDAGIEYSCWSVLDHAQSNTGICYSEHGFGPKNPWGLIALSGEQMSMGMDCAWYPCFLDAYFESYASSDIDIWRVFKTSEGGKYPGTAISEEADWDTTWKEVYRLRELDKTAKYDCHHSIKYERSKP